MVRLLPLSVGVNGEQNLCFNPTMVRLLRVCQCYADRIVRVSIPQWCDCCNEIPRLRQCSTRVSIPQWCDCCGGRTVPFQCGCVCFNPTMVRLLRPLFPAIFPDFVSGFNPTMVRLLPQIQNNRAVLAESFNPTMVRLLHWGWGSGVGIVARFNPTMVRLLRQLNCVSVNQVLVSIPQWCDCCAF